MSWSGEVTKLAINENKKNMSENTELAVNHPMEVLQRAIDSNVPTETLEKLMDLQERHEANTAKKAFNQSLVKAQSEMPTVFKGRENEGIGSRYASFDDIMRIVRPVLDRHGLAISFSQSETSDTITVICSILHIEGHSSETPFTLPKDEVIKSKTGKSVTNLAQAQGSANSYAKRYCLCNALNIVLGDQDDDANAMNTPLKTITDDQSKELQEMIAATDIDPEKFLMHYKADSFETFPLVMFEKAKATVKSRMEVAS